MTSPHLPAALVQHFAALMGASPRAPLTAAQMQMSQVYRDGGHSRSAVPDATAALAYAVARMPATYAACIRAFDLAAASVPDFAPHRILDIGAGPGTAVLAAAAVWPGLAEATLIEPHAALGALAKGALQAATALQCLVVPTAISVVGTSLPQVDLVTLSYMLAEQPAGDSADIVTRASRATRGSVIIVEPGTPQGYARVLLARAALLAEGFSIIAPCPHQAGCPLPDGDWCHFAIRLQRSSGHRQLKGADVPFEDERFSFVAATRFATGERPAARLIAPPTIEKGFADLALCTDKGLETRRIRRRDAVGYKAAKRLQWGDGL